MNSYSINPPQVGAFIKNAGIGRALTGNAVVELQKDHVHFLFALGDIPFMSLQSIRSSGEVGMLVGCGHRLAVYDIGDGRMDWQRRQAGILASWNRKTMSVENLIETTCYLAQQRFAEPWNAAECVELMNKFSMVRGVHGGVL